MKDFKATLHKNDLFLKNQVKKIMKPEANDDEEGYCDNCNYKLTLYSKKYCERCDFALFASDSLDTDEESDTGKSEDNACYNSKKPLSATKLWKQERCWTKMRIITSATSVYKGASLKASEDYYGAENNEENYEDIERSERLSSFMASLYAIKSDSTTVKLATLIAVIEIILILWTVTTAAAKYCEDNPEILKRV